MKKALHFHPKSKMFCGPILNGSSKDGKLVREWTFNDFVEAMAFVNRVAAIAEDAGHHPDIDIRYNQVPLGLVSHDAGGITERDAAMAGRITAELASHRQKLIEY